MKFTKKSIYIGLFSVLYLIVAFSSFWHACAFFGLANNSWMSIILAFAFEIGQAAVLFSLLTSKKDRSRVMPWVLMTMFTLVQVIGNVFSSYKYIILNSIENLRFFKEPIFIWTNLPDDQATVIIVYLVGAVLPIASLLLTSMITNYLSDQEEEKIKEIENKENEIDTQPSKTQEGSELSEGKQFTHGQNETTKENNQVENSSQNAKEQEEIDRKRKSEKDEESQNSLNQIEGTDLDGGVIGEQGEDGLKVLQESLNKKNDEIEQLKEDHDKVLDEKFEIKEKFDSLLEDYDEQNKELGKLKQELEELKKQNEKNKDQGEIFDLPKSELLKPTFIDKEKVSEIPVEERFKDEKPIVYNPDWTDKQKIENITGVDKEQIEDLIKNGIQGDKQENEKVSHFINQ